MAKHITHIKNNAKNYTIYDINSSYNYGMLKQLGVYHSIQNHINDNLISDMIDTLYLMSETTVKALELESGFYFYDINNDKNELSNTNSYGSDNKLSISLRHGHGHAFYLAKRLHEPLKMLYEYNPEFYY